MFNFFKRKDTNNLTYFGPTEFTVQTYVGIENILRIQMMYAIFSLSVQKRDDIEFLQKVTGKIGSLQDRVKAAEDKTLMNEDWKDFFKSWSKAIMRSNQCVLLPKEVTYGEDVYIKMIFSDIEMVAGVGTFNNNEIELSSNRIPENHILPATVTNADDLKKLSLVFNL